MPHLVKMDKRYRSKGLTLIGAERQNSTVKRLVDFVEQHDIEFPITQGTESLGQGGGIPRMVVFDVNGACVFSGSPGDDECERAIRSALRDATGEDSGSTSGLAQRTELVAERAWTNTDGNSLTAALVSIDGTTGTFRKSNGQTFPYDITKLSEADQALITETSSGE